MGIDNNEGIIGAKFHFFLSLLMKNLRFLMCFVVWLTAAAVWADEVTNSLPQSLSRVTLLANLKAGDYYAVLKNMNKENYESKGELSQNIAE